MPFHIVHGVLKARILKWFAIPFHSPVDHVLSELSTITCPSWVVLHSFIELDKAVVRMVIKLKQRYCQDCVPFRGSRKESSSMSFQTSRGLLRDLFSIFKANSVTSSSLSLILRLFSPTYKDSVSTLGPPM